MIFNKLPDVECVDEADRELVNCKNKENELDMMSKFLQKQLEEEMQKQNINV